MRSVYCSEPRCIYYDGDAGAGAGAGDAGAGAGAGDAGAGAGAGDAGAGAGDAGAGAGDAGAGAGAGDKFVPITTQDQLNAKMANNRRTLQTELEQTKSSLTETESQLSEMLQTQQFSDEATTTLKATLESVQKQLRTKEQQAEIDKKALESEWQTKFQEADEGRQAAITKLHSHLKDREWIDALDGDAHDLGVFLDVVRDKTDMVDDKVMVDLPDFDADGKATISALTPAEAVKRMRDLPRKYGGLFKSNMAKGLGGTNATGGVNSGNQKVKLDSETKFDDFKRQLKEDPAAFGM